MMRVGRLLKFAAVVVAAMCFGVQAQAQTTPVTFSLDFRALGRHAAWYVALEKGYYKDAGLDVYTSPRSTLGHISNYDLAMRYFHEIVSYTALRLNLNVGWLHSWLEGKPDL